LLLPTGPADIVNQLAGADQIDQYHGNGRPQGQFVARRQVVDQQSGKRQAANQKSHAAEVDEAILPEIQDYLLHVLMTPPAVPACSASEAQITTELRNVSSCSDMNQQRAQAIAFPHGAESQG